MRTFLFSFFFSIACSFLKADTQTLFPPALKKGDVIAVVAPASCPEEDRQTIARGIKLLVEKGYRVRLSPNLMTRHGYLAGNDTDRTKAFMDAWKDPEVKAVWCYRGGFGCTRILDRLDYSAIKQNPKVFIGMSDVTAMHAAIIKETGMVTFLGPNVNAVFGKDEKNDNPFNEGELWKMISNEYCSGPKSRKIQNPKSFPVPGQSVMTIRPGIAKGRLAGGTLSLVISLIGTPWEIETKGKILVLEEVDEEPYRIDRMLCQLKLSGHLEELAGVVLCSFKACRERRPDRSLTLEHVFKDYFANAPYPVLLGFPSGHMMDQATLPLNTMAELDATKKTVTVLEHPVKPRL